MDYSNFRNLVDLYRYNTYCIILLPPFWLFILICRNILCSEKKKRKQKAMKYCLIWNRFFKFSLRSKIKWPIQSFSICYSFPGLFSSFSDRPESWLEYCILYFVRFQHQAIIVRSGFYLTSKMVICKFKILCCYEVQ